MFNEFWVFIYAVIMAYYHVNLFVFLLISLYFFCFLQRREEGFLRGLNITVRLSKCKAPFQIWSTSQTKSAAEHKRKMWGERTVVVRDTSNHSFITFLSTASQVTRWQKCPTWLLWRHTTMTSLSAILRDKITVMTLFMSHKNFFKISLET